MKIYVASSWKNAKKVFILAEILRINNHEVDAFVDSSSGRYVFHWKEIVENKNEFNAKTFLKYSQAKRAFKEDKKWLDWCECLILLLPAGRSAHLEAGYIKGQDKKLVIYHPTEFPKGEFDVMYGFADLMTISVDRILRYLKNE